MQSKTSYFNKTLYRQSLRLSLPVGIGMTITWILCYTMSLFDDLYGSYTKWKTTDDLLYLLWRSSEDALATITVPSLLFGLVLAVTLFSYLNTPRSVQLFHALPLRREGLFFTQYAVGVTYTVLSLSLTALSVIALQATVGIVCWGLIFTWLWMAIVTTLFFFSFAVFCMMFAGVTWAGAVYFAIFNAVVMTLYSMYQGLQQTFYYGAAYFTIPTWVDWCTPVVKLQSSLSLQWNWQINEGSKELLSAYTVYGQSVVGTYGLAAVAFIFAALAVYRRRPSESASDVVAISWAKPLFRFGMALCSGLIFGFGLYLIVWDSFSTIGIQMKLAIAVGCMAVVGLVGLVVAEMLMEKTMRIGWRWLKAGALMTALFVALGVVMELDVFNVENYVPNPNQVEEMTVRIYGNNSSLEVTLDNPEDIAKTIAMHQAILDDKDRQQEPGFTDYADGGVHVSLYYYEDALDAAPICYRYYPVYYAQEEVDGVSTLIASIQEVLNLPIMQYAMIWSDGTMAGEVETMELSLYNQAGDYQYTYGMTTEEAAVVYAALKQDALAGNLTASILDPNWGDGGYYNDLSMEISSQRTYVNTDTNQPAVESYGTWRSVYLTSDLTYTVTALERLDIAAQYPLVAR